MDDSTPRNYHAIAQELTPAIFRLPIELRLDIYNLVIGSFASLHHPYTVHKRNQIALEILLVNHQIYYETRLIPFRTNIFDFETRFFSATHCCRMFVQRLYDWQVRELRHLTLAIMEMDLTADPSNSIWVNLCKMLGGQGDEDVGLRCLRLTVNGHLSKCGAPVLDHNAGWVISGLQKLKALRTLEMVVPSYNISTDSINSFRDNLQSVLSRVSLDIRVEEKPHLCTIL